MLSGGQGAADGGHGCWGLEWVPGRRRAEDPQSTPSARGMAAVCGPPDKEAADRRSEGFGFCAARRLQDCAELALRAPAGQAPNDVPTLTTHRVHRTSRAPAPSPPRPPLAPHPDSQWSMTSAPQAKPTGQLCLRGPSSHFMPGVLSGRPHGFQTEWQGHSS